MKKLKLLALGAVGFASTLLAQNTRWAHEDKYYDPVIGTLTPFPTQPTYPSGYVGNLPSVAHTPVNMYPTINNKPLFFIGQNNNNNIANNATGEKQAVFNSQGFLVNELTYQNSFNPSNYAAEAWGEFLVVPNPANCEQYYFFSTTLHDADITATNPQMNTEPVFGIYDASLQTTVGSNPSTELGRMVTPGVNNLLGGYTMKSLYDPSITIPSNLPSGAFGTPIRLDISYAATEPIANLGGARLLFVVNNSQVLVYKLDASTTSISLIHSQLITTMLNSANYGNQLARRTKGELEVYYDKISNKFRLATAVVGTGGASNQRTDILLAEFTDLGTFITNSAKIVDLNNSPQQVLVKSDISGIEFSGDGNTVYFTRGANANNATILGAVDFNNVLNKYTYTPTGVSDFTTSQIERALDNNLYLLTSNRVMQISNANNPASAIINPNILTLTTSLYNFPNMPFGQTLSGYLLPDQIDGETYKGHFDDTPVCCAFYTEYTVKGDFEFPVGTYTVTNGSTIINAINGTPVTFGAINTVYGKITIPAGANVTLSNMTFQFTSNSGVVVKNTNSGQGGKLTLNGCTLTNLNNCNENYLWQGIAVMGNPAIANQGSFTNSQQAWLKFTSTTIENAVTGITLGSNNLTGTGNFGGGVVQTTLGGKIQNCITGVDIQPCGNISTNQTALTRCTLQVTQQLLQEKDFFAPYPFIITQPNPYALVKQNDAVNTKFLGCVMQSTYYPYNFRVFGINSTNSHFTVGIGGQTPKFMNLSYGIWAQGSTGRTVKCTSAQFITNQVGAFLTTCDFATFKSNTFKVLDNDVSVSLWSTGLILMTSTGFAVEDNLFQNNSLLYSSNHTFGCIVHSSNINNSKSNLIWRNTFKNINMGNLAVDKNFVDENNGDAINDDGLKYACNTHVAPIVWADIYVQRDFGPEGIDRDQGYGIASNQALCNMNKFSFTSGSAGWAYDWNSIATAPVMYIPYPTATVGYQPLTYGNKVIPQPYGSNTNTCSTPYELNIQNLYQLAPIQITNLRTTNNNLTNIIDCGNTNSLINLISSNSGAGVIKNALMNCAPYLSEEVLIKYIGSNPPIGNLKQVLIACSPLTSYVKEKLNGIAIPTGIKNQIDAAQVGYNALTQIPSLIKLNNNKIDYLYAELVRNYLFDSIPHASDSAAKYIKLSFKPADCKGKECDYLLYNNELLQATSKLGEIISLEGLTDKAKLYELLIQLYGKDVKAELTADPIKLATLRSIVASTTDLASSYRAQSILQMYENTDPRPRFLDPTSNPAARVMNPLINEENSVQLPIEDDFAMSNYPNPFNGTTTIYVTVPTDVNSASLIITDVLGRDVAKYNLVEGFNNVYLALGDNVTGTLFYTLYIDGKRIQTKVMNKN